MENGFYAAQVTDDSVRSVHVDEDTVYYMQTAKLFEQRDDARAKKQKRAEENRRMADRKAARERKELRKMVLVCGGWIGAGVMVFAAYLLGPVAVAVSTVACFGAACFKLGCCFRKVKAG